MNWAVFALAVSAVLFAVWLWQVIRRRWSWAGLYASFGCLLTACFNSAAPVRGVVDPNYVGFSFGLVSAKPGIGVTAIAGAIFLSAAASALIGASRTRGKALLLLAATCAALFVIIGIPTIQGALSDPASNAIQFGEYLTIPGGVATAILLLLMAVPFAVGAIWGARAAWRGND